MITIFVLIWSLFLIGGIGLGIINKGKQNKNTWIKFITYFAILNWLFVCICYIPILFKASCLIIALGGLVEILQLRHKFHSIPKFQSILLLYTIIGVLFCMFSVCSQEIVLFTLFIVCIFDAFSQLSGQLFGRHKISPRISPNKMVEGTIGGTIVSLIMSFILGYILSIDYAIHLGIGIIVSAFFGDLFASYIKRQCGVKDFSKIFPGHGGFMDRFDSFLLAGVFVFINQVVNSSLTIDFQYIWLLCLIVGYILVVLFCERLNYKGISPEYTRKAAHFISAISALAFPYIFADYIYVILLTLIWAVILLIANKKHFFNSIDGVSRKTGGSYLLSLALGIMYLIFIYTENYTLYALPILVLAICDPIATIMGKWIKSLYLINGKTLIGSISFAFLTFSIAILYLTLTNSPNIWKTSIYVAFVATFAEIVSPKGTDNLTIPVSTAIVLYLSYL